jgi:hypothetical protein
MKTARTIYYLIAILIAAGIPHMVQARGNVTHKSETVDAKGAKRIEAEIKYGAGKLSVEPSRMSEAAKMDIMYSVPSRDYDLDYELSGEVGILTFETNTKHIRGDIDTDNNRLDVTLSDKYPTDLTLEVGACDAQIDLGGLRLTQLKIEVGASTGDISFSRPNPERMREFGIEAGAASVNLSSLGNANFEHMKFEGGVGKFRIDLRGEYHGESEIDMEIGLGSATIILPDDVAVRILADKDNWLSSVDFHSHQLEEVEEGVYESPGFDQAKTRIILKLEVGLGSADIRWR